MANKVKAIKVDDVEYSITQIGGVEGLELFDRLAQEMGATVLEGVRQALTSGQANEAMFAAIAMRGLVALPLAFKRELWTKFAQLTVINAGAVQLPLCLPDAPLQVGGTFDQHFAGRFPHMWKWLMAAMKWGFASFLPSSEESADKTPATPTTSP